MGDLVQIGSPSGELLVPQTTLPDLLCHTITDGELDLLTSTTATMMGGLFATSIGVVATSIIGAWPAIQALQLGDTSLAETSSYIYLGVTVFFAALLLISGVLSGLHQRKKVSRAAEIRKRPKVPMRMSNADTV